MEETKPKREYDLTERTAVFGEQVIRILRAIRQDSITKPLISQAVRSGTSVGANYAEADEAGTKKEFKYRISICSREVKETKHWLRMLSVATDESRTDDLRMLWKEADELNRIFAAIGRNTIIE